MTDGLAGRRVSDGLATFNAMPDADAERALLDCCGSRPWARTVLSGRPFASADSLLDAADAAWRVLPESEWMAAFRHHPRIGESRAAAGQTAAASAMSAGEQRAVGGAPPDVRAALAEGNRSYEERFGFIFIICASGRTPEEILAALRARMHNDPHAELRAAAEEQRMITRLRLRKLLGLDP